MKKVLLLGMALCLFGMVQAQEQNETTKSNKKVTIVKKWVDDDGKERSETIIREAEDVPENEDWLNEAENINQENIQIQKEVEIRAGEAPSDRKIMLFKEGAAPELWGQIQEEIRGSWPEIEMELMDAAHGLKELGVKISQRPFLGVVTEEGEAGALITEVVEGSAAEKAGLKVGDQIVRIGEQEVANHQDIVKALHAQKSGDVVAIHYVRDGASQQLEATLGQRQMRIASQMMERPNQEMKFYNIKQLRAEDNTAFLGVMMETHEDGVHLIEIVRNSPAKAIGLQKGDMLFRIDKTSVNNPEDVSNFIKSKKEGETVVLHFRRDGKRMELPVVLGSKAGCCSPLFCPPGCCEEMGMQQTIEKTIDKDAPAFLNDNPGLPAGALTLSDLRIFPNPTTGQVRVAFKVPSKEPFTVRIMDAQGKEIMVNEFAGIDQYDEELDLRNMPSGNYTLLIEQEGQFISRTIIRNQ